MLWSFWLSYSSHCWYLFENAAHLGKCNLSNAKTLFFTVFFEVYLESPFGTDFGPFWAPILGPFRAPKPLWKNVKFYKPKNDKNLTQKDLTPPIPPTFFSHPAALSPKPPLYFRFAWTTTPSMLEARVPSSAAHLCGVWVLCQKQGGVSNKFLESHQPFRLKWFRG